MRLISTDLWSHTNQSVVCLFSRRSICQSPFVRGTCEDKGKLMDGWMDGCWDVDPRGQSDRLYSTSSVRDSARRRPRRDVVHPSSLILARSSSRADWPRVRRQNTHATLFSARPHRTSDRIGSTPSVPPSSAGSWNRSPLYTAKISVYPPIFFTVYIHCLLRSGRST